MKNLLFKPFAVQKLKIWMALFLHPTSEIPNPFLVFVSQTADKKWTALLSLRRTPCKGERRLRT